MDMTAESIRPLIAKHSMAGPRYTSYPTAPQWSESLGREAYRAQLESGFLDEDECLSLYIHVPFCESLCYYCGCNIQITKDHGRSLPYLDALTRELRNVSELLGKRRSLAQMSWGGGTPTFLEVAEIERLFHGVAKAFDIAPGAEISIEVDPRVTSRGQLECLRALGFNRLSLGVQDFDPRVQTAINREQSVELTGGLLEYARGLGFRGINFDLIYGLPHQSLSSFRRTIAEVLRLRPDRIALYNYARLPSLLKHQAILEKLPMPEAPERVEIFLTALESLTHGGYRAIGMDHFALADDDLARALDEGALYRNFMGYTVQKAQSMVGVGASAIGEIGASYFQNLRKAKDYETSIATQGLAAFRGCLLSEDDRRRKWIIQRLMCKFDLRYDDYELTFGETFGEGLSLPAIEPRLAAFESDGILQLDAGGIRVTEIGRLFIRNVAMIFDAYLGNESRPTGGVTYSRTV